MRVGHPLGPGPDVSLQRDLVPATQGPVDVGDPVPEPVLSRIIRTIPNIVDNGSSVADYKKKNATLNMISPHCAKVCSLAPFRRKNGM